MRLNEVDFALLLENLIRTEMASLDCGLDCYFKKEQSLNLSGYHQYDLTGQDYYCHELLDVDVPV